MHDAVLRLRTRDPEETRALAAAVVAFAEPGDAFALSGELGAGKTCFVQGAARALGVTERVTSPTFILVRSYPTDPPLVHCDVYRLDRLQDVLDLGDDVLAPDVITFIEWGDTIRPLLPDDRLDVELYLDDPAQSDGDRRITIHAHGEWVTRLPALSTACAAWRDGG